MYNSCKKSLQPERSTDFSSYFSFFISYFRSGINRISSVPVYFTFLKKCSSDLQAHGIYYKISRTLGKENVTDTEIKKSSKYLKKKSFFYKFLSLFYHGLTESPNGFSWRACHSSLPLCPAPKTRRGLCVSWVSKEIREKLSKNWQSCLCGQEEKSLLFLDVVCDIG